MLASLLLGLLGSLGHCVGMCGPVVFLFDRQPAFQNKFAWALAHAGRITSYSFLGIIFGAFGQALWSFDKLQAALSILFALVAFYLAAAFIGLVPSPELLFVSLTRRWGRAVRAFISASLPTSYVLGVLWGFLPCGLTLTALVPAIASKSPVYGALNMLVFGIATVPSLLAVKWFANRTHSRSWSRALVAVAMMLFGFQFAMRGFASLGLVGHFMLGKVMFW
ncbi:MAG: sulfite exporter TauE/SafE family protein [Anaerolineaceae bacterium]|nr:sulfite exporter TauE/SafE family protein [Anaerolineaceae bacterium]